MKNRELDGGTSRWNEDWKDFLHDSLDAGEFLSDDFEPYSRKMVEAYAPLVAARAAEPKLEYQTIDECINQILDRNPPEDFDIDELRSSESDERAMRNFLVRELREHWSPLGSQVIPGSESVVD